MPVPKIHTLFAVAWLELKEQPRKQGRRRGGGLGPIPRTLCDLSIFHRGVDCLHTHKFNYRTWTRRVFVCGKCGRGNATSYQVGSPRAGVGVKCRTNVLRDSAAGSLAIRLAEGPTYPGSGNLFPMVKK